MGNRLPFISALIDCDAVTPFAMCIVCVCVCVFRGTTRVNRVPRERSDMRFSNKTRARARTHWTIIFIYPGTITERSDFPNHYVSCSAAEPLLEIMIAFRCYGANAISIRIYLSNIHIVGFYILRRFVLQCACPTQTGLSGSHSVPRRLRQIPPPPFRAKFRQGVDGGVARYVYS